MDKFSNTSTGGILLMSLVIFGMMFVMLIASISYISRQFKETIHQEHKSRAFQAAEGGVHYALWLLSEEIYELHEFEGQTINKQIIDPVKGSLTGKFSLTLAVVEEDDEVEEIIVTSAGTEEPGVVRCETIVAVIKELNQSGVGKKGYVIDSWDHLLYC